MDHFQMFLDYLEQCIRNFHINNVSLDYGEAIHNMILSNTDIWEFQASNKPYFLRKILLREGEDNVIQNSFLTIGLVSAKDTVLAWKINSKTLCKQFVKANDFTTLAIGVLLPRYKYIIDVEEDVHIDFVQIITREAYDNEIGLCCATKHPSLYIYYNAGLFRVISYKEIKTLMKSFPFYQPKCIPFYHSESSLRNYKNRLLKHINEELMSITWNPDRFLDWCLDINSKHDINKRWY